MAADLKSLLNHTLARRILNLRLLGTCWKEHGPNRFGVEGHPSQSGIIT